MKESKEIKGKSSVSPQAFLLLHGTLLLYAVVTVLTKLASGYLSQANWPMTLPLSVFQRGGAGRVQHPVAAGFKTDAAELCLFQQRRTAPCGPVCSAFYSLAKA